MSPIAISQSSLPCDIWPSRPCHMFESNDSAMFTLPLGLIVVSGYKLLYLYPHPIFMFPRLIIHEDSLRVVQYPTPASMLMETRLLFNAGRCRLGVGWLNSHSTNEWGLLWSIWFHTPACCLVRLCRLFQSNSLKTIWYSREMWCGVQQPHSLGIQQHWLGCQLENGLDRFVLVSDWFTDHSLVFL